MKKTVLTAAFALTLFAGTAYAQSGITGKWDTTVTPDGGQPLDLSFDLKAGANDTVTGKLSMPAMAEMGMGEAPISDGKIKGKDVTFKIKITPPAGGPGPGGDMVINYVGKLDGDKLTLDTSFEGGGPPQPQLIAKRAPAAKAK